MSGFTFYFFAGLAIAGGYLAEYILDFFMGNVWIERDGKQFIRVGERQKVFGVVLEVSEKTSNVRLFFNVFFMTLFGFAWKVMWWPFYLLKLISRLFA